MKIEYLIIIDMEKFYFFTDLRTNASSYCLLNIKKYADIHKSRKKLIFIDPSVYELRDSIEYSKIALLHELANGKLLENEYISIDYPCDMNEAYSELFIEKSIRNNLRYTENPKYICTIQFKFQDFTDFKRQFEYLEEVIDFSKKIVGIGNLCRILRPNQFSDEVFDYLNEKVKNICWLHFYGLGILLIRKYAMKLAEKTTISVDSTKWTRACNNELKRQFGKNCNIYTRNMYFLEYIRTIQAIDPSISVIF